MRGEGGSIIHGRTNDTDFLDVIADHTVVVEHNAAGYNKVTHIDWIFNLGVETGYNDQGITFSEEILGARNPNKDGFLITYLARMALEESSNLKEVEALFTSFPVIGGYGTVWSDRKSGKGIIIEVCPTGWVTFPFEGNVLWNLNHYYDKSQAEDHQIFDTFFSGNDYDRNEVYEAFDLKKPLYFVEDAISFLQAQQTLYGDDYSWFAFRMSVCNLWSGQMIVFDPRGDGIYYSWGNSFAP